MRIFTYLFLLVLLHGSLYPSSEIKKIHWNKYLVTYKERKLKNSYLKDVVLEFQNLETQKIEYQVANSGLPLEFTARKMKSGEFLYLLMSEGNKHGSKPSLHYFIIEKDKVIKKTLQAETPPIFLDVDGDSYPEILIKNTQFEDFSFWAEDLGTCKLTDKKFTFQKENSPKFPIIYYFNEGKELKRVTFSHKGFFHQDFQEEEEWLEKNEGKFLNTSKKEDHPDIRRVLVYYYYSARSSQEKRALLKLKNSKLSILLSCVKNNESTEHLLSMMYLLTKYRNQILWNSED
ncbi:MAG: hypothetical protein H7A25_20645 [Leptospiraceae bacterium]|nr:hypothetical protein [Leptospiraceae bacterium]MCP5502317.1 hypothetical protein [Leptospiraceae bacterium]